MKKYGLRFLTVVIMATMFSSGCANDIGNMDELDKTTEVTNVDNSSSEQGSNQEITADMLKAASDIYARYIADGYIKTPDGLSTNELIDKVNNNLNYSSETRSTNIIKSESLSIEFVDSEKEKKFVNDLINVGFKMKKKLIHLAIEVKPIDREDNKFQIEETDLEYLSDEGADVTIIDISSNIDYYMNNTVRENTRGFVPLLYYNLLVNYLPGVYYSYTAKSTTNCSYCALRAEMRNGSSVTRRTTTFNGAPAVTTKITYSVFDNLSNVWSNHCMWRYSGDPGVCSQIKNIQLAF